MRFLDTNIFIRYLTRDDPQKAQACYNLLQRIAQGVETATSAEAIVAEVVYVLGSPRMYNLSHADIRARLVPIISLPGLQLEHKSALLRALDLFAAHRFLDFEDALCIAHMERLGIPEIVSYDTDFDRISGVHRIEP